MNENVCYTCIGWNAFAKGLLKVFFDFMIIDIQDCDCVDSFSKNRNESAGD